MVDDRRLTRARELERDARRRLLEGCDADLAAIQTLFADTLFPARKEIEDAVCAGEPGASARQALVDAALQRLSDNAGVRFRARFRTYVDTVVESEGALSAKPRRVALPRLRLRRVPAPSIAPEPPHDFIERFFYALDAELTAALHEAVRIAQRKVVRDVISSVARARARRHLRRLQ